MSRTCDDDDDGDRAGLRRRRPPMRALDAHPRRQARWRCSRRPLHWLLVVYIGSLVALLDHSLFYTRPTPSPTQLVKELDPRELHGPLRPGVYRTVASARSSSPRRVTVIDLVIALPIAFYMAKVASPVRGASLVVAVMMPLWAGYLVKGYAWRAMLDPRERRRSTRCSATPRASASPATIIDARVPVAAVHGASRSTPGSSGCPNSLLEASTDLGAKAGPHVPSRRAAAAAARRSSPDRSSRSR